MGLLNRIEELEKELLELKELVKEEKEFPQDGDRYWYINPLGFAFHDEWSGLTSEEHKIEIGNVFKTEEQVDFAVEKLKVEAELRKFSRPFVWGEENWVLYMSAYRNIFLAYENDEVCQGVIYFESEEKALEAIETVGAERIKKYLFGVED